MTAPFFSIVAAGSGRRFSLRTCAGRPLVLIFHGRDDSDAARDLNREIRTYYPSPEELTVASVIDLSSVPPPYWLAVGFELDRAYRRAASELPADADPRDFVVILPDWSGSTTRKYRAKGGFTVAVIGGDSSEIGVYRGRDRVPEVMKTLGERYKQGRR